MVQRVRFNQKSLDQMLVPEPGSDDQRLTPGWLGKQDLPDKVVPIGGIRVTAITPDLSAQPDALPLDSNPDLLA